MDLMTCRYLKRFWSFAIYIWEKEKFKIWCCYDGPTYILIIKRCSTRRLLIIFRQQAISILKASLHHRALVFIKNVLNHIVRELFALSILALALQPYFAEQLIWFAHARQHRILVAHIIIPRFSRVCQQPNKPTRALCVEINLDHFTATWHRSTSVSDRIVISSHRTDFLREKNKKRLLQAQQNVYVQRTSQVELYLFVCVCDYVVKRFH
jgi:hypothetical protein